MCANLVSKNYLPGFREGLNAGSSGLGEAHGSSGSSIFSGRAERISLEFSGGLGKATSLFVFHHLVPRTTSIFSLFTLVITYLQMAFSQNC